MASQATRPASGEGRLSSVANAILLMKTFSDEENELGISALADRLGLAKSTVHRLASTLVEQGMLEQNPETGKYRLGLTVFELGSLVRRKIDISREAKPWLMALREQTGETVLMSILGTGSVVCINFLESQKANRVTSGIGLRKPIHCTAEGKALLAFQPQPLIERVIEAGLDRRTAKTITDPAALREELASIRANGYATDDEEYELGMRSISAPIRDDSGSSTAAVAVAGPAQRLSKKQLLALADSVILAAKAISARLGGSRHA
ncbi:MAG TPA: IclR family transcriptional regulator [Magnetospirillaceae bacterium]|nr:IclR family transcriptional regulator [Magnetospirillaceae bacterium]